jgi:hypothetical protein
MKLHKFYSRKQLAQPLTHTISALWVDSDQRWSFTTTITGQGWFIRALDGNEDSLDNKWLKSLGIYETFFPTRKEAVETLSLALN